MTSLIRVLRQFGAPTGRNQICRAILLPDEPIPPLDKPLTHTVLAEAELVLLLDEDGKDVWESAPCACCDRTTEHTVQKDGSLRCGTCGTTAGRGARTKTGES